MDEKSKELLDRLSGTADEATLFELRSHSEREGDLASLALGLCRFAHAQSDKSLALEPLIEAGQLYAEQLRDLKAAHDAFRTAFEYEPALAPAVTGLRKVLAQWNDDRSLIEILEQHAEAVAQNEGDPVTLAQLHFEIGNMWRDRFDRVDRAVEHYRSAVDCDAAQRGAIKAAREIYEQAEKWDSVAKLLGLEAESYPDGEKKASLLAELGTVHSERLGNFDAAYRALSEAARSLPGDLGVQHRLATLLLENADHRHEDAQAPKWRREAADILTSMAEACDDEYALPYSEAALDAMPDHERALHIYEQVARRMGRESDIPGRWVGYVEFAPEGPRARPLRLKLARAYLEAGQPEDAEICLEPLVNTGDADAKELIDQVPRSRLDISLEEPTPVRATPIAPELLVGPDEPTAPERRPIRDTDTAVYDAAARDIKAYDPGGDSDETVVQPGLPEEAEATAQMDGLSAEDLLADERTPVHRDPHAELSKLREQMHKKLRFRDRRGAADVAERLLAHAPTDPDALMTVEDVYRNTRKHHQLRDTLMRLARLTELPLEGRLPRLREAAQLSASQLKDVEGHIAALSLLVELQPSNKETFDKLHALLTEHGRWNELVGALEARLKAVTEKTARVALYRELLNLHRTTRDNPEDAIKVLRELVALEPNRREYERELFELYAATDRHDEVLSLLNERLKKAQSKTEKAAALNALAEHYEERQQDLSNAYKMSESVLELEPDDNRALTRMERIDEAEGRLDRLVAMLLHKAQRTDGREASELFRRAGAIAARSLQESVVARDAYERALHKAPDNRELWDEARGVFDEFNLEAEFDELLEREIAAADSEAVQVMLRRMLAARKAMEDQLSVAIETMQELLDADPADTATRNDLIDLLAQHGQKPGRLADELGKLADTAEETSDARDLRVRRAELFLGPLENPQAARDELERILADLDPRDSEALDYLIEAYEALNDNPGLAGAIRRRLRLDCDEALELELAKKLAELCDGPLNDHDTALEALRIWTRLAPKDRQAHELLLAHLQKARLDAEELSCLDALAELADTELEKGAFVRDAARVADTLNDGKGAWRRLLPLVTEQRDETARAQLQELAEKHSWGVPLAEVFLEQAQRAQDPTEQTRMWTSAAHAYEMASDWSSALEATLRALALDMEDGELLLAADRLAAKANAWPRLDTVYQTLARRARTPEARTAIFLRHAKLLEEAAKQPEAALERVLAAADMAPNDEELFGAARRLADETGRTADILPLYEARADLSTSGAQRARTLLEASALTYQKLEDRARGIGYLSKAVAAAGDTPELLEEIERRASELDKQQPPLDGRGMQHALSEVYKLRAEDQRDPILATVSLQRAARLLAEVLEDDGGAYQALAEAYNRKPDDARLLDDLTAMARRAGALGDLLGRLRDVADSAIQSSTASLALRRLGDLLAEDLERPHDAADVFRRLVALQPADPHASSSLLTCLRDAHRYQELLVAIDQQLSRKPPDQARLALLRQAASCWEQDLKNPYEAREAWQKVLTLAPDDREAKAALISLQPRRSAMDEDSLLGPQTPVLPEDLTTDVPEPSPAPQESDERNAQAATPEHMNPAPNDSTSEAPKPRLEPQETEQETAQDPPPKPVTPALQDLSPEEAPEPGLTPRETEQDALQVIPALLGVEAERGPGPDLGSVASGPERLEPPFDAAEQPPGSHEVSDALSISVDLPEEEPSPGMGALPTRTRSAAAPATPPSLPAWTPPSSDQAAQKRSTRPAQTRTAQPRQQASPELPFPSPFPPPNPVVAEPPVPEQRPSKAPLHLPEPPWDALHSETAPSVGAAPFAQADLPPAQGLDRFSAGKVTDSSSEISEEVLELDSGAFQLEDIAPPRPHSKAPSPPPPPAPSQLPRSIAPGRSGKPPPPPPAASVRPRATIPPPRSTGSRQSPVPPPPPPGKHNDSGGSSPPPRG